MYGVIFTGIGAAILTVIALVIAFFRRNRRR